MATETTNPEGAWPEDIEAALRQVGELLEAEGADIGVVVVGGAALNLAGIVRRVTRDVDVMGIDGVPHGPLNGLPPVLDRAVREVARDRHLPLDWMNVQVSTGLTPGTPDDWMGRVTWRRFRGLRVGIAAREDMLWLKLWALADNPGREGRRHLHDLLALAPTTEELDAAEFALRDVDANPQFADHLKRVAAHVAEQLRAEPGPDR
jgi:hypothetical protein